MVQIPGLAADASEVSSAWDVAGPAKITGTLYEPGSHRQTVLYHFVRTATNASGSTVCARCSGSSPLRTAWWQRKESVFYRSNQLVAYEMKEFQANLSGSIQIEPDTAKSGPAKICIGYGKGLAPPKGDPEALKPDTLIDDDLYPRSFWSIGTISCAGETIKFHFVSIEWQRIFIFRLVKTGERLSWRVILACKSK